MIIILFITLTFAFVIAFLGSLLLLRSTIPSLRLAAAQALASAESGVDVGMRAVRDNRLAAVQSNDPSANGYALTPALDFSARTGAVGGSGDPESVKTCERTDAGSYMLRKNGESVAAGGCADAVNYAGARLEDVAVECVVRRVPGGGSWPLMAVEYSADGGASWKLIGEQMVKDESFQAVRMQVPQKLSWKTILGRGGQDFKVRVRNTGEAGGVAVDYLCLRATVRTDANTAPWHTRSYIRLPARLPGGAVRDICADDESGKVNINTASQPLLKALLLEYGVSEGTASALASALVSYRSSHTFRSVEEVLAVPGMTPEIYGARMADPGSGTRLLRDDLTVFSWINRLASRSAGVQAPVNINTAPEHVLRAVLRPLELDTDEYRRLAADIIARRKTQPFGCVYASNPDCDPYSFYAFLKGLAYLTPQEVSAVMENADLSSRRWTGADTVTAGFSFSTNSWTVTGAGTGAFPGGKVQRAVRVACGDVYDYETLGFLKEGSLRLPVAVNDQDLVSYWKEIE